MRRLAEAVVFGGLATAVHAAALFGFADGSGLPGGGGDGGNAILTVAAAPPSVARQIEAWDRSPVVGEANDARIAPDASAPAPVVPAEAARPNRRADPSPLSDPRRDDAVSAVPDAPPPPRAPAPPKPPAGGQAEPTAEAPPQAARRAAGDGGDTVRGHSTPAETASRRTSDTATLMAEWSARIRARIERRKAAPGGRWEPGGALLRIRVSAEGTLLQLGLLRSSGDKRLDDAAVSAVQRAGPFPAAPKGLPYEAVTFDVPVLFAR